MPEHFFDTKTFISHLYTPSQVVYDFTEGGYTIRFIYHNYVNFYQIPTNYLHMHNDYEICLVVDGTGEFKHGEQFYPLTPGSLFIADPNTLHEITSYKTKDLYLFFFTLEVKKINNLNNSAFLNKFLIQHNIIDYNCSDLLHYLPLINRNFKGNLSENRISKDLIHSLIIDIIERLSSDVIIKILDRDMNSDLIIQAEDYVSSHMNLAISVEDVAKSCHISSRHLRRIIRAQYNKTVIDWIKDKKLNTARFLLDQQYSVQKVCNEIGFADPNYFSQLFKKHFSLTPTEYKKRK